MLLDLRSLYEAAPAAAGVGGGASGRDITPAQLRRFLRQAQALAPAEPPYMHPRPRPVRSRRPKSVPVDQTAIHVLYELGEIDELELAALLAR